MAIVSNLAGTSPVIFAGIDPKYETYTRSNAGEPNASLTPAFVGEIVLDTTNNCLWKAVGTTTTSWVALTPPN